MRYNFSHVHFVLLGSRRLDEVFSMHTLMLVALYTPHLLTAVGSPETRDENSHGPPNPSRILKTLLPIAFAIAIWHGTDEAAAK